MKYYLLTTCICISGLLLSGCGPFTSSTQKDISNFSGQLTPIHIAAVKSVGQLPLLIADQQGYLADEGIKLEITWMAGGDQVFKALSSKTTPLGLVGLVPYGFVAEKFPSIKLVTIVTDLFDTKLIVNKDRITTVQDIKGKKIGYSKSTASDIHLKQLLNKLGLSDNDIEWINLSPAALATALAQGDIDGYSAWEPNIANGTKVLSGKALIFDAESEKYEWYFSLFTDEAYAKENPEIIQGMVNALTKSTTYINAHPAESKKLIAEFLSLDPTVVDHIWSDYSFNVAIQPKHREALIHIFEWVHALQGTGFSTGIPDISTLIYTP